MKENFIVWLSKTLISAKLSFFFGRKFWTMKINALDLSQNKFDFHFIPRLGPDRTKKMRYDKNACFGQFYSHLVRNFVATSILNFATQHIHQMQYNAMLKMNECLSSFIWKSRNISAVLEKSHLTSHNHIMNLHINYRCNVVLRRVCNKIPADVESSWLKRFRYLWPQTTWSPPPET